MADNGYAFIYARDSGANRQELSILEQLHRLRTYAQDHGLTVLREYTETKQGSTFDERVQLQALMSACREKPCPVSVVLVWDLSRLGREQTERLIYQYQLRRYGVKVVSLAPGEESLDGPFAPIIDSVLSVKDALFLEDLSRNVKRGHAAMIARGRMHGHCPAGYRRELIQIGQHRDGTPRIVQRWTIDEERAPLVRQAFVMYVNGASAREIHAATHLANTENSYRGLLDNPIYKGDVKAFGVEYHDENLRIVSDELWAAAHVRKKQPIAPRRVTSPFLLSGILYCGACHITMSGQTHKTPQGAVHRYYRCRNLHSLNAYCGNWAHCDDLDAAVLSYVLDRLGEHVDELVAQFAERAAQDDTPQRAQGLDTQIARSEKALSTLLDLAETGTVALTEIRRRMTEREAEIAELRRQRAELVGQQVEVFDEAKLRAFLASIRASLTEPEDNLHKRRFLAAILDSVTYTPPDGLHIVFKSTVQLF